MTSKAASKAPVKAPVAPPSKAPQPPANSAPKKGVAGSKPGEAPPPAPAAPNSKRTPFESEFERLKGLDTSTEHGTDVLGPKGLQTLCQELGIAVNDFDMYVLAWRLGASQSYTITRAEWSHAGYSHKIEHIAQLRTLLTSWRATVKQEEPAYQDMYNSTYDFIRGDEEKLLPLEKAVKAWTVLFPDHEGRFKRLGMWIQWVTTEYKRPITRDLWRQLYEFSKKIRELETYDPNDKWPSALDDFVEWAKEKLAQPRN